MPSIGRARTHLFLFSKIFDNPTEVGPRIVIGNNISTVSKNILADEIIETFGTNATFNYNPSFDITQFLATVTNATGSAFTPTFASLVSYNLISSEIIEIISIDSFTDSFTIGEDKNLRISFDGKRI